jgi:hypothetical protein
MSQLDAGNGNGRVREGLEPCHRRTSPLDGPVDLLDQIVEVLVGPHLDVSPAGMLASQQPQCAPARHMTVECYLARDARQCRGGSLANEGLGGSNSSIPTQQEVDGRDMLVDSPIKVMPPGLDRDVRLFDSP